MTDFIILLSKMEFEVPPSYLQALAFLIFTLTFIFIFIFIFSFSSLHTSLVISLLCQRMDDLTPLKWLIDIQDQLIAFFRIDLSFSYQIIFHIALVIYL